MYAKIKKICFFGWWLIKFIIKMLVSMVIAPFVKQGGRHDSLWLIMELPYEARDNGYWLYKHIIENHPEINVKYVLSKDSPDYAKMLAKENLITPYSWQHYISYILSKRSISTHIYGACPGRYYTRLFSYFMPFKEEIFLQHGVTKAIIPLRGFSSWTITASATETTHFIKSGHKQPNKIIQAGFCRFDNLRDTSKNQAQKIILIMPTYRNWLGGHTTVSNEIFKRSSFYKTWKSILNNDELNAWLVRKNYKIIFYPHRQMQNFVTLFSVDSNNVEVATKNDYDIQDLLCRASLLITDYSSVTYDFSYMKKPVLLYPFDSTLFYTKHLGFSGHTDTLGDIIDSEQELLKKIMLSAETEFKLSAIDIKKINTFFTHTDNKNCERNFKVIEGIV